MRALLIFSFILLIACGAIHAATFAGIDLCAMFPALFLLHPVVLGLFITASLICGKAGKKKMLYTPWTLRLVLAALIYLIAISAISILGGPHIVAVTGKGELPAAGRFHELILTRIFSVTWVFFISASWMMLAGARQMVARQNTAAAQAGHD